MGKATGFKEFERALPQKESVESRTKTYNEFISDYTASELNKQAARCMDCGIPFCHSGCPLGNVIPEFNDAVYKGKWEEAYQILVSTNNFPEFTGRICPAPCEAACVLGINKNPITIEEIEKHIIEIAFKKGYVKPHKNYVSTGKRIAVVGSGPAGLAAAAQLNKAGHDVVVYEKDDKVGGLLRYGIPDFKLEKGIIDRRVDLMKASGIEFRVNAEVGANVPTAELNAYDAIVLAGGCNVPRDLNIPGRDLKGVHFAMDYLTQQNKRVGHSPFEAEDILATGKNVLVIGDGDTGSDCIGTANRQGAKSVTQVARKALLPKGRTAAMPWPTYPNVLRTSSSQEEGCVREWSVNTKAFLGDQNGQLRAAVVVEFEWELDHLGRAIKCTEIPGSAREIPCELATLALGFVHPQHAGLLRDLAVQLDPYGNVKASEEAFQTTVPKVFVAGDMRRGQSLVVWAISEGRECARKVDEFLMGVSNLEAKDALHAQIS